MQAKKISSSQKVIRFLRNEARWLAPGIGLKRWLMLVLAGSTLIGVGIAVLLLDFYRTAPESWWLPVVSFLSLRFLFRPLRAVVFGGLGVLMIVVGMWGFNRALLKPFIQPGRRVLDSFTSYRKLERGPRIVAIGGGTGLSTLLRGLKNYSFNITAIVTVADDGGSSGELRRSMGILPPGDIRNCLTALANDETLMGQLFQYRFASGNGLSGHTVGNLLITALAEITGSFEEAVAESGRVLAVRGQVLPATLHDVKLVASVKEPAGKEVRVKGESQIPEAEGVIQRVWLEPNNPHAYPPTVQALLSADLILVGPGSLYTSILPNLLVPDLMDALRISRAQKFYICNVATQPGETDGFSCEQHVKTIEKHVGAHIFDLVICNNRTEGSLPEGVEWVIPGQDMMNEYPVYCTDLCDDSKAHRHDSNKLAQAVMDLYQERTGPLMGDVGSEQTLN